MGSRLLLLLFGLACAAAHPKGPEHHPTGPEPAIAVAATSSPGSDGDRGMDGSCSNVSDCYGLGDCVDGKCQCDSWASNSPNCDVFSTMPLEWDSISHYRNESQPNWSGAFALQIRKNVEIWSGFIGSMVPGYINRTHDFRDPELLRVSRNRSSVSPFKDSGWNIEGTIPHHFMAKLEPLPTGGWVLFTGAPEILKGKNLQNSEGHGTIYAAYFPTLDYTGPIDFQVVFSMPAVDPNRPWICYAHDWGVATILPDGSVIASFRNGGHHCPEGSYPGWPNEQIGLLRASCWNCTDYRIITDKPLFIGQRSGKSNEDNHLFWSHRGIHMIVHSQDNSNPKISHKVRGAVAFSPDITSFDSSSWVISPRACYNGTIALANDTVLQALRRQRPGLIFPASDSSTSVGLLPDKGSWPKRTPRYLTNVVDLVYPNNSNGWGDGWTVIQEFD